MAIFKPIYKCKQCKLEILDDDAGYRSMKIALKSIGEKTTHVCENSSGSRKIGILELIGFWEKK